MKKKYPKHLTILGRKYKLKFVDQPTMQKTTDEPSFAAVDFENKIILVLESLSDEDKMLSILHELGHITHVTVGANQVLSFEMQEILCESGANAILDLVKSLR